MPIGGALNKTTLTGSGYKKDPMRKYAQNFSEFSQNLLNESSIDIFEEPGKILRRENAKQSLKEYFVENFMDADPSDPYFEDAEDRQTMMEQQFENDVDALFENADMNGYNPVIGLTFPIHKNILMNMVFDKGAIQKVVAEGPKFTMSMERRILVDSKGNEIDMFTEQNKMTAAIDDSNPVYDIEIALPENQTTDVLTLCGGTKKDSLSIKTHVSLIQVAKVYIKEGDIKPDANGVIRRDGPVATAADAGEKADVWFPVNLTFKPGYNQYERTFVEPITLTVRKSATANVELKTVLTGVMDHEKFIFTNTSSKAYDGTNEDFKKVMLSAELDTSNAMLDTCSVSWKVDTTLVEIPNAIPLNVTISPEEVKDLAALYQVNQLTKVMSLLKTTLANYKDDKIKQFLDNSYDVMDENSRGYMEFDYAPPSGYALDPLTWRHAMFFDAFDSQVTKMTQVLNDPNMVITVFGDPDLIRKITPTTYTYQTPASIGPVELDYKRTVVTSDKRVYQFIGSDKLRWNDTLVIILCPRNSNRVTYRIYDYQMYVSNEIRNAQNPALPAIHAFERWKIMSYQPVQSRCKILNRSGMRS